MRRRLFDEQQRFDERTLNSSKEKKILVTMNSDNDKDPVDPELNSAMIIALKVRIVESVRCFFKTAASSSSLRSNLKSNQRL